MSRKNLYSGKTIGKLELVNITSERPEKWMCLCSCGNEIIVSRRALINEVRPTRSCGCYRTDRVKEVCTVHGMNSSRLKRIYAKMKSRCNNINDSDFIKYGGRGIKISDDFSTFSKFLSNMPEGYREDLTIDRIDNDGDYEPGNVRWANRRTQAINQRAAPFIEDPYTGKRYTRKEISEIYGISYTTVKRRHKEGWSFDRLITPTDTSRISNNIPIELVKEIKRLLWSHTVTEVSILTDTSRKIVSDINERLIYDDVDE